MFFECYTCIPFTFLITFIAFLNMKLPTTYSVIRVNIRICLVLIITYIISFFSQKRIVDAYCILLIYFCISRH